MVNFTIRANGMQNFFPPALNTVNINWRQRARQLEKGFSFEQRYTSLTYKPVEKSSDYLNEMKEAKEDVYRPFGLDCFQESVLLKRTYCRSRF